MKWTGQHKVLKLKSSVDVYHIFTSTDQVEGVVKLMDGIVGQLEVSRERQAWSGVRDAFKSSKDWKKRAWSTKTWTPRRCACAWK